MTTQGYQHEAVFYAGEDAFVAATLPFLHEALDNGEPTLVALPGDHLTTLRDALGAHNGDVSFVDMATIGRNPACIIAAWVDFVDAHRRHGTAFAGSVSRSTRHARPPRSTNATAMKRCSTSRSTTTCRSGCGVLTTPWRWPHTSLPRLIDPIPWSDTTPTPLGATTTTTPA